MSIYGGRTYLPFTYEVVYADRVRSGENQCTSPQMPDRSTVALASLVAALGLTPYLYPA